MRSAAAWSIAGVTWLSMSRVSITQECPSRSAMIFAGIPAAAGLWGSSRQRTASARALCSVACTRRIVAGASGQPLRPVPWTRSAYTRLIIGVVSADNRTPPRAGTR